MNIRKKTQLMTIRLPSTHRNSDFDSNHYAFKIVIPPASYTLGSHIPIFIAMFLFALMAAAFAIIASSLGFRWQAIRLLL